MRGRTSGPKKLSQEIGPYLAVYAIIAFELTEEDHPELERLVGYGTRCARDYLTDIAFRDPAHFAGVGDTFLARAAFQVGRRAIHERRWRYLTDARYRAEAAALIRDIVERRRRNDDPSIH